MKRIELFRKSRMINYIKSLIKTWLISIFESLNSLIIDLVGSIDT